MMLLASGGMCIYLRGTMAPLYLALMFDYLESMNNRLCSLMHGGKEIEENFLAIQKLLKLKKVVQEKVTFPEGAEEIKVDTNWPTEGKVSF